MKQIESARANDFPSWFPFERVQEALRGLQPREIVVVIESDTVGAAAVVASRPISHVTARGSLPNLRVGDVLLLYRGGRASVIKAERNDG